MSKFMDNLIDTYNSNYEPGDALLLYMAMDGDSDYDWLYDEITLELTDPDVGLAPASVLGRFREDRLRLYHARDTTRPLLKGKKWMSAGTLAGAARYAGNLDGPGSRVQITQLVTKPVTQVYDMVTWMEQRKLSKRLKFYQQDPELTLRRMTNEAEHIVIFKSNPIL